jgi:hypothetical protein
MRYTGRVSNAFVQSVAHNFEQALRLMEAALTDCPDDLWQADLWPDEAPTGPGPHGGPARLGSLVPRLPRAQLPGLRPDWRVRAVGTATTV